MLHTSRLTEIFIVNASAFNAIYTTFIHIALDKVCVMGI